MQTRVIEIRSKRDNGAEILLMIFRLLALIAFCIAEFYSDDKRKRTLRLNAIGILAMGYLGYYMYKFTIFLSSAPILPRAYFLIFLTQENKEEVCGDLKEYHNTLKIKNKSTPTILWLLSRQIFNLNIYQTLIVSLIP